MNGKCTTTQRSTADIRLTGTDAAVPLKLLGVLAAMATAIILAGCGSEPPATSESQPTSGLPAPIVTAVAEAESAAKAAQEQIPTVQPAQVRNGYCGSLCDAKFWVFRAPTAYYVKARLDQGTDVTANSGRADDEYTFGWTPLHMAAAWSTDTEVIALLLNRGADIATKTNQHDTPLHLAARYNTEPDVTRLLLTELLEKGIEIDVRGNGRETPLISAAGNTEPLVTALLLNAGADVNAAGDSGWTPLHRASSNPNGRVAALLLDAGADINAKTVDGQTPLHRAASDPNGWGAVLILDAGADINAKADNGLTPLHGAAINSNGGVAAILLDAGADINAKDIGGQTPLHSAASDNLEPAVIELLLERGADIDAKTFNGQTPLHSAATWNSEPAIVAILLEHGADIHATDGEGKTACQLATEREKPEEIRNLVCP